MPTLTSLTPPSIRLTTTVCHVMDQMAAVPAEFHRCGEWTITSQITAFPRRHARLQDFVDEMSNWYVRRSRERFWVQGLPAGQDQRLYDAVHRACHDRQGGRPDDPVYGGGDLSQSRRAALIQAAPESVHLCDYPAVNDGVDRQGAGDATWRRCWRSSFWAVPPATAPTAKTASRLPPCTSRPTWRWMTTSPPLSPMS